MVSKQKKNEGEGLFKSVLLAYVVLALHVVLIAGLGLLVIFFRGIVNYMMWIFLGGSLIIGVSAWYFYRRMKAQGKTLKDILKSPTFNGRPVEVSLLGGLASIKLGSPASPPALQGPVENYPQLEDPETTRVRELMELARLLEKELITPEEFNKAKHQLMK